MAPENKIREKLSAAEAGAPVWNSDKVWASLEINKKKKGIAVWWYCAAASVIVLMLVTVLYRTDEPQQSMSTGLNTKSGNSKKAKISNSKFQIPNSGDTVSNFKFQVSNSPEPSQVATNTKPSSVKRKKSKVRTIMVVETHVTSCPDPTQPEPVLVEVPQVVLKPVKRQIKAIVGGGPSPVEQYAARRNDFVLKFAFEKSVAKTDAEPVAPLALKTAIK